MVKYRNVFNVHILDTFCYFMIEIQAYSVLRKFNLIDKVFTKKDKF